MNVLSLFDGMSCGQIALNRIGIKPTKYYASELDKYAIKVSQANYPDTIHLGDVTKWRSWDINWSSIDLLIGGSPCQGFSFAGKQLAFDDPRSMLFFVYVDILNHIRSVNPRIKFMLENVKMKKEYLDVISELLEVQPVFINSALLSAQNRQRYYWCNWGVEQPEDKGIVLADILEGGEACDLMTTKQDKSFVLTASYNGAVAWNSIERKQKTIIKKHGISETCVNKFKRYGVKFITPETLKGKVLTAGDYGKLGKYGNYLEVKCAAQRGRYDDNGEIQQQFEVRKDDKTNSLTTVQKDNFVMRRVATATDLSKHVLSEKALARAARKNYSKPKVMPEKTGCLNPKNNSGQLGMDSGTTLIPYIMQTPRGKNKGGEKALDGKTPTLSANSWEHNNKLATKTECAKNVRYRKLTPIECERLQTVPDNFTDHVSNSQRYKMLGNGWTIDVIAHIFSQMEIPIQVYARQLSLL